MAFPTIPTVADGRVLTTNQADTSGTRTFPSLSSLTKNSGDLLIAIAIGYQSAGTSGAVYSSWGGSFTELTAGGDQMTTSGSTMCIGIASKISTGSETGTFTVTQASPTGHATLILLSIPGAHDTTAPEAGTIANGTGAAADPGSFNPAGWGTEDTLWIALAASGMTSGTGSWTATGTTAPANYTDRVDSNTTDNSTVGQTEGAVAFRQLNAASEDIGTAGVDTSNARNSALVIAVRPAVEVHSGSGAITVPAATVAGSGTHVANPAGTGAISVPAATVAGSGAEVLTATGAVSIPAATVAGTGAEVFTATGAITVPAATTAGTGDHTLSEPEGTGAISVPPATVAGTGALVLTGAGAFSVPAATVAGTGVEVLTATGAVTVPGATVAGSGLHFVPVTGTGSIVGRSPVVVGAGLHVENAAGTGAISVPSAVLGGTGSLVLTGTGAILIPAAMIAGTGDHAEAGPPTGTGSLAVPSPLVSGSGSVINGLVLPPTIHATIDPIYTVVGTSSGGPPEGTVSVLGIGGSITPL